MLCMKMACHHMKSIETIDDNEGQSEGKGGIELQSPSWGNGPSFYHFN